VQFLKKNARTSAGNKKGWFFNMQKISTSNAPAAIGPYSQGMSIGNMVFSSGQIPIDPATGEIVGTTIEEQAAQSCKNVGAVLTAGGSGFDKVIKTTCFLADMADFPTFNAVYEKYFISCPARSCVAVKDLPKGVLCEVEAIGYISE
jgi:2-iminobutanoate/2-iminopropanoate deaminase